MPKFTFIAEHDSGQKVTYDCDHDFLDHVLEDFDLFLRGVGFFPQGDKLQYVSDETYYGDGHDGMGSTLEDYPELYESTESPSGTPWAAAHYGHDINLKGNK